jgi:hypothetical protein
MQNVGPEEEQDQTIFTPLVNLESGPQSSFDTVVSPARPENKASLFYTQDGDDDVDLNLPSLGDQDQPANQSSPFVLPFQNSAPMPTVAAMPAQSAPGSMGTVPSPSSPPVTGKTRWSVFPIVKNFLISGVVLITVLGVSLFVFAQSVTSSGPTQTNRTTGASTASASHVVQGTPAKTKTPIVKSTPRTTASSSASQEHGTQATGISPSSRIPSTQLLSQIGWTQAGLTQADAIEAIRTAATFTDREMSLDYRNMGTPQQHGGTLTSSTFLLTPGGLIRFLHNDKRAINNAFYNQLKADQMTQQVVSTQAPALVQVQTVQVQGKMHQFAWVNVPFELFQSKRNPTTGQDTEDFERDSTTGQPLTHHLIVLLERISPQNQGVNAPMGGTGWLVNTYALDTNTLPAIATSPSL